MKVTNSIVKGNAPEKKPFHSVINSPSIRGMIEKSLGDPRRAASFVSTLISTVSSNKKLAECRPETVISAALKGEAMDLSLQLQQFSIVQYGDTANYQLSYKGLSQLATRSGQYLDFGVYDVREGEYKGKDSRTRQPVIEWLDDDDAREKLPLAGFYGFYELKNGFSKSMYWTHDKILSHADRYSMAFSKEKYEQLIAGKLKKEEAEKLKIGTPWYGDPLSEEHMKMCRKTVLMQMLNDGTAPLSIEMQQAINNEVVLESTDNGIIYEDDPLVAGAKSSEESVKTDEVVVESTATVTAAEVDVTTGEINKRAKQTKGQMSMNLNA